jgi:hypothetical protein
VLRKIDDHTFIKGGNEAKNQNKNTEKGKPKILTAGEKEEEV